MLTRLRNAGANAPLLDALELATELEDVMALAPHGFEDALNEVESGILAALRALGPMDDRAKKWLQPRSVTTSAAKAVAQRRGAFGAPRVRVGRRSSTRDG